MRVGYPVADALEERVLDPEDVPVWVSDMEGDSSMLGEADSDERMVNDDENDGSGVEVVEPVMVIEELGDPMGEDEGVNEGEDVMDDDQEAVEVNDD